MNTSFRAACAFALAVGGVAPAFAQVGVSVDIGAPGFYGQLDLGGVPPPQTIYAQPVVIDRGPSDVPPLYLRVPPGQERNWRRYCRQYDACGRPVYFVRDDWYRNVYAPRYREVHARGDRGDYRGPPGRVDDRGRGRPEERARPDERGRPDGGDRGDRGHEEGGEHRGGRD